MQGGDIFTSLMAEIPGLVGCGNQYLSMVHVAFFHQPRRFLCPSSVLLTEVARQLPA